MALPIEAGNVVEIVCNGEDEKQAAACIKALIG